MLVRGFYPKEVQIFDGLKVKGKGVDVDGEVKGLEGALEDMGDEGKGRERVLNDVEKTITDVYVPGQTRWVLDCNQSNDQVQCYTKGSTRTGYLPSTGS